MVVPPGTWFVRVSGLRGAQRTPPSNEIALTAQATAAPMPPVGLLGSTIGAVLALWWCNAWDAAAPNGIQLTLVGAVSASFDLALSE